MSRKGQNNHYHYAEMFEDRARRARRSGLPLPRRAVFLALLVLILFGVVSTTFSVNNTAPESDPDSGSIMVRIRNPKVSDYAGTGANVDLAKTGAAITGGDIFFIAPDDWDISNGVMILTDAGQNHTESLCFDMDQVGESRIFHLAASVITGQNWKADNGTTYYFNGNTKYCFLEGSGWNFGWNSNDGRRKYSANYTVMISASDYTVSSNFNVFTSSGKTGQTGNQSTYYEWDCDGNYYSSSSDFATDYRFDQVFKMQYKVGSGNYTDADSDWTPGSLTLATTYWNSDMKDGNTTTKDDFAYNVYTYNNAVKTAPVDLTATAGDGFILDGIYDSGGNQVDTTTAGEASYIVSGAATYYAKFHADHYTITLNITNGNGTSATSAGNAAWKTGYTVPTGRYYTEAVALPTGANMTATGRTFGGWYENASCTGEALTSIAADKVGNTVLYAKWDWDTFDINYHDGNTGGVSGITNPNGIVKGSKTYNVDYTIISTKYARTGYNQAGWSETANDTSIGYNFGANYATNDVLDLYPVWTLNTPTVSIISSTTVIYDGTTAVSVNLSPSESTCPAGASRAYSYTITRLNTTTGLYQDATSDASIGTNSGAAATYHKFSTTVPGTYRVTWTVTDTSATNVTNPNNRASATSGYATIYVKPAAPIVTLDVVGKETPDSDHTGSDTNPYMILIGNNYHFTATVSSPVSTYNYTFSKDADFSTTIATVSGSVGTVSFSEGYVLNGVTAALADLDVTGITVYCRAECNGQENDNLGDSVYYFVQKLVESFNYVPFQKIFNINDSSVVLEADYNLDNATGYTSVLNFSDSNASPYTDILTVADRFMRDFNSVIKQYFYASGPKYFFIQISGTNSNNEPFTSHSLKIHTTVGASDFVATRPLYFHNGTGENIKNYTVMCYYVDGSGKLGYQAAQDLGTSDSDKGLNYRVMIPEDATSVIFGFLNVDEEQSELHYYGMPTLSEQGVFGGMTAPIFKGRTNQITLTDATRRITASTGTTVSGFMTFSCTAAAY